jgi:hypothetical protein
MSKNYKKQLNDSGIDIHGLKGVYGKGGVILDADTGLPTGITNTNVGTPVELLTYIDPKVIEILFAPRNATKLFGEVIKGDWTTERRKYALSEIGGNVAPYGDFSENGQADINNEFMSQDYFRFQTMVRYGDFEVARTALAKIALIAGKQKAANLLISIMSNRIYMYGISGLDIYGILNHPLLPAYLTATTGATTSATDWKDKTADEIFEDFLKLIADLISKSSSLIDATSKFKSGISTNLLAYLQKTNQFGISVTDLLKKNYPNLEIIPIPEFSTSAGEVVYIIAPDVAGETTGEWFQSAKKRVWGDYRNNIASRTH